MLHKSLLEYVEKIILFIVRIFELPFVILLLSLLVFSAFFPRLLNTLQEIFGSSSSDKELIININLVKVTVATILAVMYILVIPKLINTEFGIKKLNKNLQELANLLKGNSILIRPSKHPEIWDGFVNTYYVVNAPWQLERYMDTVKYRDMVNLHVERYKNPDLKKSIYIFFKNTEFEDTFRNFAQFIKDILQEYPEAAKKVKILISEGDPINYSLFLGEKKFRPEHTKFKSPVGEKTLKKPDETISYSIVYIHDRPFTNRDGYPSWAVVSINSDINQVLRQYVEDLIHNSDCQEIAVSDFIERFGS